LVWRKIEAIGKSDIDEQDVLYRFQKIVFSQKWRTGTGEHFAHEFNEKPNKIKDGKAHPKLKK
jgi:hypothetical protein